MDLISSIIVIIFAALIHASFQLSVSVLTLLSGHTIGARRSHAKVLHMTTSFVLGAATMTTLILSFITLSLIEIFGDNAIPTFVWAGVCGLMFGIAVLIWIFYYRRGKGTMLWIPRSFARFLSDRTKSAKSGAEAFSLGLSSVLAEMLFIIAPISISALVILQLPDYWSIIGSFIYIIVSLLSLITVWVLIGSGHNLSSFQKWRESNKYFLQFAAGTGLVALALFVYVNQIISCLYPGV